MLAFLLAAGLSILPTAAPDTVLSPPPEAAALESPVQEPPDLEYALRVPITTLYSGTYGFGLAGGIRLTSGSTAATLDARLAQHLQAAALTLDTHDARTARVFGRVRGVASTESRWRYHGIGARTDGGERIDLDLASARAVAAVGVRPVASRVLTLQPEVGVRVDRLGELTPRQSQNLINDFDALSRAAADASAGATRRAAWLGLVAEVDTRDRAEHPSSGTLASVGARRLGAFDASDLRMTRIDASAAGFVPLGQRVVLFGRASASLARADDGAEIPVFYLPTADPDRLAGFPVGRFRGRDAALFSVGVRVPIIDALGTFGLDATVTASAGNAYRDVFDEFSPAITTRSAGDGASAALRPALGLGLALVNIPKGRVALGGTLGLGPQGVTLFAFRLATGLSDDLPVIW